MRTAERDTFHKVYKDDTHWMSRDCEIHDIKEMDIWHVFHSVQMLRHKSDALEKLGYDGFYIPDLMIERLENEFAKEFPEYMI
jgi:hypothetical protein